MAPDRDLRAARPFGPSFPIGSLADIERLEETPLDQAPLLTEEKLASMQLRGLTERDVAINSYPLFQCRRRANGVAGVAGGRGRAHRPDDQIAAQQGGGRELLAPCHPPA